MPVDLVTYAQRIGAKATPYVEVERRRFRWKWQAMLHKGEGEPVEINGAWYSLLDEIEPIGNQVV
jgi:hypothetical protein